MSVLAQQVYDMVSAAGGRMVYAAIQAALSPQDQGNLPSAFKECKRAGLLRQEVSTDPGTGAIVHEYIKVA